nr:UTRA domain-containing protein [Paraburkholderia caribensis]
MLPFTASNTLVGQTSTQRSQAVQRDSLISSIKTGCPVRRWRGRQRPASAARVYPPRRPSAGARQGRLAAESRHADLANRDIFHVIEQDCGVRIGHADLSIRSMPASNAVAAALEVEPGSSLLGIERVVYSRDGAPVLFEALNYRGDAFQYQLRIERSKR